MKSDNAIRNGTSIFVGIIVAIAAFVRGALLLPLLLVACSVSVSYTHLGRHFSAVSLFVAAGLSQRCSVVSLQSVLHGELRSSSRCDFPIPKAVQPGCPNGFRTQFRFLRKRHLRHVRLDAAARSPRRAGYGFRLIQAYRHCVGDARRCV